MAESKTSARTAVVALAVAVLVALTALPQSAHALDLVEIGSAADYERFALGTEYHAALIFFYASWDKHTLAAKKVYIQAAEMMTADHVTGLVMGMVDGGRHPDLARSVGVKGFPALFLYQFGAKPRTFGYGFHNHFTAESVIQFAMHETNTHRGHLAKVREALVEKERTHYDFPHPAPGTVIELSTINFNRVIRDPTKTGFVMFYAEWCDICKNTMPDVERLAKYFVNDTNVVIGRLEVDNNKDWIEANGFVIDGVPVFWLFPRGRRDKEKGWQYLGDREFDPMAMYVERNSNKPEQDMQEFHAEILANKPDNRVLPEFMHAKIKASEAMPDNIFGPDGRPLGEPLGGMKSVHPVNSVKEGREASSASNRDVGGRRAPDHGLEDLSGLTEEERAVHEANRRKRKHPVLPASEKGKID